MLFSLPVKQYRPYLPIVEFPSFLISGHPRCNPNVIYPSLSLFYLYIHMNIKYQLCCLDNVDSIRFGPQYLIHHLK